MIEQAKRRAVELILAKWGKPVFLAGLDLSNTRLTLHVGGKADIAPLKELAKNTVRDSRLDLEVCVRTHSIRRLAYPTSVAHLVSSLDVAFEIHDPTLINERARKLLMLAERCRERHSRSIRGLYFDPDGRTFFVWNSKGNALAVRSSVALLAKEIAELPAIHLESATLPFSVRVVKELPNRKLVPVDARSASLGRTVARVLRRLIAPSAIAAVATAVALPAWALSSGGASHGAKQAQDLKGKAADKFGMLYGLTIFADGQRLELFPSSALERYFGEQLAQAPSQRGQSNQNRWQDLAVGS